MKKQVIIVGAGAAGLMAAQTLSGDFDVTILESRSECGGRIRSFYFPGLPQILEEGPEFVHGRLPLTLSLLKKAGIGILPVEGKMYRKKNGILMVEEEMVTGWDGLMNRMKREKENLTINAFLDKYYSGPDSSALRKQMIAYAGGFDLADPSRASIKELYEEWSHEGDSFRIPTGYLSLIHFLQKSCEEKGCRLILEEKVKQVNWQEGKAELLCQSGRTYTTEKVIVTVPLGQLNGNTLEPSLIFQPALGNHLGAFRELGFGTVIKVLIHFKDPFWNKDTGFILSDEQIPTWWTLLPLTAPVLTGWAGGPAATALSEQNEEEILETALVSLSNIFSILPATLRNNIAHFSVLNWHKIPEAHGAYSYSTPGSRLARRILNTPLDNTIYFAGEGLYHGPYPGTVEAALTSGKEIAGSLNNLT